MVDSGLADCHAVLPSVMLLSHCPRRSPSFGSAVSNVYNGGTVCEWGDRGSSVEACSRCSMVLLSSRVAYCVQLHASKLRVFADS